MRKIIASEFLTVDGVMEDPGGAEKSKHGGWAFQFERGPEGDKVKFDELMAADALLLGRKTYEGFAVAWPSIKDEAGFAERMNGLPKYVVSTTLKEANWNNSRIISSNVADEVSKLKQQPGQDILIAGSGQLIRSLMDDDLVDEFRLMLYPVVLGTGKRLFTEGNYATLKLVEAKPLSSGIMLMRYEPDRKAK
jgi:dihydrofolate reductase